MFNIYAIYNRKHKKIYIGQTENLEVRLQIHISKIFKNSFTAKLDGEWELIYKEEVPDRKQALIRETTKELSRKAIYKTTYSPVAQW